MRARAFARSPRSDCLGGFCVEVGHTGVFLHSIMWLMCNVRSTHRLLAISLVASAKDASIVRTISGSFNFLFRPASPRYNITPISYRHTRLTQLLQLPIYTFAP